MPTLNFPTNPAINDTYTFGGKTWYWTGQGWRLTSQGAINGIPIGNLAPASGAFTTLTASFLTAGPATFTGNVIAGNVRTSNISILGNINSSANVIGNLSAVHINATSSLNVNGPITAAGNVTGAYFVGNGSQLTGIVASGGSSIDNGQSNVRIGSANANITVGVSGVGNVLVIDPTGANLTGAFSATGNIIGANFSTLGNTTAAYYQGNGRFLTGIAATLSGNLAGNIDTGPFWINSANGEVRFGNNVSVVGNIVATNDLIVGDQIVTTGNVTGNYFIGDGSQLTNLPAGNYSNANVAAYMPVYGGPISAANITAANVSANYYLGNGRFLTGITTSLAGNLAGNIDTLGFSINSSNGEVRFGSNISVIGNVVVNDAMVVGSNIATTANVTANYFIGDGSQLTNLPAGNYSNANVAAYLPVYGGNVSAANVSANYYTGNGRFLSGILTTLQGSLTGNLDTGPYWINSANGLISFGNNVSVVGNIIATNDLIVGDQIATTGNITTSANVYAQNFIGNVFGNVYANIIVPGANTEVLFNQNGEANASAAFTFDRSSNTVSVANVVSAGGNIIGANLVTTGQVSAAANVSGDYFIGNGRFLSGIDTTLISNGSANVRTYANGNVTVSASGVANVAEFSANGVSVSGTIISSGNITTPANISAGYFIGNFAGNISGNLTVPGSNTQVLYNLNGNADAVSGFTFDKVSNTVTVGNVVSAVGNIVGGNLQSNGLTSTVDFDITGAVTGNLVPSANLTYSLGNTTDRWKDLYLSGNSIYIDSQVIAANASGLSLSNTVFMTTLEVSGNATVGNLQTPGLITASGNTTAANFVTAGLVTATGNITGGNIDTAGLITATGNVTGGNINTIGVVSATSNIIGANLETSGEVTATGNITTAANVSANYYIGNGRFLTGIDTTLITNGNSNVKVYANSNVAVTVANVANVAVFTADGLSISSNLSVTSNVSTGGILTDNYYYANGTPVDFEHPAGANTEIQFNLNSNFGASPALTFDSATNAMAVGGTVSASGNITGANFSTAGVVSATGNITGGNVTTGGLITATGNVTGGNLVTAGDVTATGIVTAVGNVIGGNINTTGLVAAQGNVSGGNLLTGNDVVAIGNVSASAVLTTQIQGNSVTISATGVNQGIDLVPNGTGNINVNSHYINNVLDPQQAQDAATKFYVDSVAQGLNIHDAVEAATPDTLANISAGTISYNNGNAGVGANLVTTGSYTNIDGVNIAVANTRILVKNEANAAHNGVYVYSNATVLIRATDYDSVPEVERGDFMFVAMGNTYGNTGWVQTTSVTTIGVDAIGFTQFSGSGAFQAGNGLSLSGVVFNVNVDPDTTTINGSNQVAVKASANLTTPNIGNATGGSLSVTGNIDLVNLNANGYVSATGNLIGANISTSGSISAAGNITGANIIGTIVAPAANTYVLFNDSGVINGNVALTFDQVGNVLNIGAATGTLKVADIQTPIAGVSLRLIPASGVTRSYGNLVPQFSNTYDLGSSSERWQTIHANVSDTVILNASANITGGNLLTGGVVTATGNITGGNLVTAGAATVTGNITGGNVTTSGQVVATANITGGNLLTGGEISAVGNITGNYYIGNGRFLTGIDTTLISNGNSNVKVYANANVAVTVANVANVAVFTVDGAEITANLTVTGNVQSGNVIAGQARFTDNLVASGNAVYFNTGNFSVTDSVVGIGRAANNSALVTNNGEDRGQQLWFYDGSEKSAFVGFQNLSGKILLARDVSVSNNIATVNNYGNVLLGNIDGENTLLSGLISATGNVAGGNLTTIGNVDATGNISANYYIGNGRFLSGIDTTLISNGNSNVKVYANANVEFTVAGSANVATVAATGIYTTGVVSATGNITASNIDTLGTVTANTVLANNVTSSSQLDISSAANANILISAPGAGLAKITGSSGFVMPVGNTAQRPNYPTYANVDTGTLRYNSTIGDMEVFNGSLWVTVGSSTGNITIIDQQIAPDGVSTTYALTQAATAASIIVTWNGVQQIPNNSYTVTGNSITFVQAPLTTDDIDIRFLTGVTGPGSVYNTSGNSSVYVTDVPDIRFTVDSLLFATITANGVTDLSTGHSLQLPSYSTAAAQALTGVSDGQVIYVTDGDSGSPCLAVYSGACWKRVTFGACISPT